MTVTLLYNVFYIITIFSTAITPDAAAIIAATLANGGQCPFTGDGHYLLNIKFQQ